MSKKPKSAKEYSSSHKNQDDEPKEFKFPIEPVIILHMVSALLGFMTVQDVLLQKACKVDFAFSDQVCSALESKNKEGFVEEEQTIQKFLGPIIMWRMILINIFPIILVFLFGAWSDKFGRKLPILIVLSSFIIYHLSLIVTWDMQVGTWFVGLLSSGIVSLGGSNAVFGMAIFSYVADTTPKDKMSQRTAITGSCFFLGVTIGLILRGILAAISLTLVQVFGIAAALEAFAFLYLLIFIKNVRDEKAIQDISTVDMVKDIFNVKHISDTLTSVFKKRTGSDRAKLILLLLCHALVMTPFLGETSVSYLFTRYQLNWDAGAFATFMTYKMIVGFIGNFVSVALLTGTLKLSDPAVGIVSCVASLVSSFIFAFATSPMLMYVAPIVALLAGSITAVARTIMFKIIPGHEIGKVNSFIGSLESCTQLVVSPMYSMLYTATFEYFPGCFYLLSAVFMVPPILVHSWLLTEDEKDEKEKIK